MVTGHDDIQVISASLDRFEGDYAVIYDNDDREKKYHVLRSLTKGIKAGSQVRLYLKDSVPVRVESDAQATKELREKIQDRYRRLLRGEHLKE